MNTQDLSKLGFREIDQLGDLLKAYAEHGTDFLGNEVKWEYNPMSDNLFLTDEDYNVGMLTDEGKIEQWIYCGNCGNEGFASEFMEENPECVYCPIM